MSFDTLAGIYVYAMDHHSGQWSRLYRLLSKIHAKFRRRSEGIGFGDKAIYAIQGNRHTKREVGSRCWEEWEQARTVYRKLKRRRAE